MEVTRIDRSELLKASLTGATSRVGARAIIAGVIAAFAIQLLLMSFGAAIGLSAMPPTVTAARGVAIYYYVWLLISLCLSAFFGAWISAAAARSPNRRDGVLSGFMTWASATVVGTVFVGGAFLRAVAGIFGLLGSAATGQPPSQTQLGRELDVAGLSLWAYFVALVLPLICALFGGLLGSLLEARRLGFEERGAVVEETETVIRPPTTTPTPQPSM
jgi:MFS family permease